MKIHRITSNHRERLLSRRQWLPWSISLFDLYPTFATLAAAEAPPYVQARSLLTSDGELAARAHRPVFMELPHGEVNPAAWESSMVKGRWRVSQRKAGTGYALFDTERDPTESVNLLRVKDPLNDEAREALEYCLGAQAGQSRLAQMFGEPAWSASRAGHRDELQALGYL